MAQTTRKERAAELLKTLETGPAFSTFGPSPKDEQTMEAWANGCYRIWATTWVLGELKRLIPELKNAKISPITGARFEAPHASQ